MPDGQVTIDPQFQPPSPDGGRSGWLRLAGVAAVAVVAFILGWLVRSPTPGEPEATAAAPTSTTALTVDTTTSTTRSRPSTTTTTLAERVGLAVPLGEAVPGFTDTLTMVHWDEERVDVLHWRASQPTPETIASFGQGHNAGWFVGLDASGRWAAQVTQSGLLTVHPVPESVDEQWPERFGEAVDVRVASAVWHDHDPGRLAWVKCSRSVEATEAGPLGVATLYSFDMTATDPGEPVAEVTIDGGCTAGWGVSPHVFSWGYEGARYWSEADPEGEHLIRPDGVTVELPADAETVVGPNGSAVVIDDSEDMRDRPGESYLLAADGTSRSPVPGLADDEWLDGVLWSPDGSLMAYQSQPSGGADPVIRIVELDTGSVVAEVAAPDRESWPVTWSTDGRYLLVEQTPSQDFVNSMELVFCDTETGSTVPIPMPIEIGDIRTFEPAPAARLVAHYLLDGDAADVSGYGHHGTVIGAATTTSDRFGFPDAAYRFEGDGAVIEMAKTAELQGESVSIAAWVKLERDDDAPRRRDQRWWVVVLFGEGGHLLAVDDRVPGGLQYLWGDCESAPTEMDDGSWHHLAMTRKLDGTIRLYVDGAALPLPDVDRSKFSDPTVANCEMVAPAFGDLVWIGGDPIERGFFPGAIDDVRIYTGVLSNDEIAVLAADRP